MTIPRSDGRLACGRDVQGILDQVAEGRAAELDAHQSGCLHCRAALAEYDRLWSPVRELAAERVEAPASVLEVALEKIRQVVEHADHGLLGSAEGLTRISVRVVVAIARRSAQEVPGVRVALSRYRPGPGAEGGTAAASPRAAAGVTGGTTTVEVTLAADYGTDLVDLGDRVRRAVAARVCELTGMEPASVSVVVDDVLGER